MSSNLDRGVRGKGQELLPLTTLIEARLFACIDVLNAVALILEDRAVRSRELLPAANLAGCHVSGDVDAQEFNVVDGENRKFLNHQPAVAVATHRRTDNVSRVAQGPGVQRRARERGDSHSDLQHTTPRVREMVLEGIPAGRGLL